MNEREILDWFDRLERYLDQQQKRNPHTWRMDTYTTALPDTAAYSEGFDDGWTARGATDGKPK